MATPNCFNVYATSVQAAAKLYGELFEMEPVFTSPRYVAFPLGGGVHLSLWSGAGIKVGPELPRTSEICLNLEGGPAAIDALFVKWSSMGVATVKAPYDDIFGRTFLVADPYGNLIRVAPAD